MCGISGIILKNGSTPNGDEIKEMVDILNHRGPDANGILMDMNIALGSNRLAIIDLDERSNQPMNRDELTIVFNGAIYNYLELKAELSKVGLEFKTTSDTEVILAAYKHWGESCVDHFNGMWAFAIYDSSEQKLFCSRDRFGIKPFYYFENQEQICFASEIKAFKAVASWQPKVNEAKAIEYMAYGLQDHTEETLFDNVFQLRQGHNLSIDLAHPKIEITKYNHFKSELIDSEIDEATDLVKRELDRSINWRLRAEVKIGSCLSGGIDSSSIVCSLKEMDQQVETFSAVYTQPEISEKKYVDEVIEKTGFKSHQFAPAINDFEAEMKKLVYIQDEPFSTTSIFAQNQVFAAAKKEGIKVMLDGQGGDEIFAGYDAFMPMYLKAKIKNNPISGLFTTANYFLANQKDFQKLKERYQARQKKLKKVLPQLLNFNKEIKLQKSTAKSLSEKSIELLTGMGLSALLHYEDRNSMHHSIESRLPFLDDQLVTTALSLPENAKINKGVKKFVLRESMKERLPKAVYDRQAKLGFETPHEIWLIENENLIRSTIKNQLADCPLINTEKLDSTTDLKLLFRVYLFALWRDAFV